MKILNMILFFAAIMLSIMIFDYHPIDSSGAMVWDANYSNLTCSADYNYSSCTLVNGTYYSSNVIWEALTQPWKGAGLAIVAMLILFATYLAIISLFNLIGFGYRSDISMMSIFFVFIVGVGFWPIGLLYTFINREVGSIGFCSAAMTSCWFSEICAIVVAGPIFIMWIMACVEWWTQRSVSN